VSGCFPREVGSYVLLPSLINCIASERLNERGFSLFLIDIFFFTVL
jgi:hypothetical protein